MQGDCQLRPRLHALGLIFGLLQSSAYAIIAANLHFVRGRRLPVSLTLVCFADATLTTTRAEGCATEELQPYAL